MATDPTEAYERPTDLDACIAQFLAEVAAGRRPDPQEWVRQHPEHAAELSDFFDNRWRFQEWVDQLVAGAGAETVPTAAAHAAEDRVRYFGDYELLEKIAEGGMGVVYKARQTKLNRVVAVKMIRAGQLANDLDVKRFHAEAQAAARLDHPDIVPVYEIGSHEGRHYFSMAYVPGPSLSAKLAQGPLPARGAAEVVKAVAEAVEYAHRQGVIHRDLKPHNILLEPGGRPKVTDFGLARQVQGGGELTATGQILGTPSYMAPEQVEARRGGVTRAADVYGLGAVLYELLTGRPPFRAATPLDTMLLVIDAEPVPPRALNPRIPADLETVCMKCLEKGPRRRYESAQQLADDLGRYLLGEPIQARAPTLPYLARAWLRTHTRVAVAAVTVGVLGGALVGGVDLWAGLDEFSVAPFVQPPPRNWRPPGQDLGWAVKYLSCIFLFPLIGLLTVLLGKTKDRQGDVLAGLVTALVLAVCMFGMGFGWRRVQVNSLFWGAQHLAPLVTFDEPRPGQPDVSTAPRRRELFEDAFAGMSRRAFWVISLGLFGSLFFFGVCLPVQTATAGYLLRRPNPEAVPEHTPPRVRALIAERSARRLVWLRLVLAPYWVINFSWMWVGLSPVPGVVLLWSNGLRHWPVALLCVGNSVWLVVVLRQFIRLALYQATRFQVHQAILTEHVDLLDRAQWFAVDWVDDLSWLRREWEFGYVTRAQGILFLDEAGARFAGRAPNGDRVDLSFPAATTRVSLRPVPLEWLRTLGGRLRMHGESPGVGLTTAAGGKHCFRAQRLFGIDLGHFVTDSNRRTQEVFAALKQRLAPAAT